MNIQELLIETLQCHKRVGLTGPPWSGKTAAVAGMPWHSHNVYHTDDFIDGSFRQSWSGLLKATAGQDVLVEGCAIPRAVEYGLLLNVVIVINVPLADLPLRHRGFWRANETIIQRIQEAGQHIIMIEGQTYHAD